MTDSRRRFAGRERTALYLAANGRCSRCGAELEPGWHADHIDPHARGGITDVINGQALCPPCNLKKGARMSDLRKWQEDGLREFALWVPKDDKGFLVEATPGAGKTRLAIEAALRLLSAGVVEQVVVAVPTSRLEKQWHNKFAKAGVSINPKWHASDGRLAADEQGCAVTYAEIAKSPHSFRRLTSCRPTLVILDEIHHCGGEDKPWGDAARIAFEPATRKILLSGTPWRTDDGEIPFMTYRDGLGVPDVRYGYRRALADGVVRAVFFPRRGGKMEWIAPNGYRREATFDDKLNIRETQHRLRTALSLDGEWLPEVIRDADAQLMELREDDPTAGGIVFCEDAESARWCHGRLTAMGRAPVLAITDEPESDQRIEDFEDSDAPWIVTIRKVSEGVDIPRLRVGIYATPWVAELFFRQVVGRLVRVRDGEEDQTSYLFIPDDDRLRAMAERIKEDRDAVLKEQQDDLLGSGGGGDGMSLFTPLTAVPENKGTIGNDGVTSTPVELAEAERVKRMSPVTARLPSVVVAELLRNAGHGTAARTSRSGDDGESSLLERKTKLRKVNNSIAARIAKRWGLNYGVVGGTLNDLVGLPRRRGVHIATEDQLEHRLRIAQEWFESGLTPRA